MRFVGDVHGRIDSYLLRVEGAESFFQVGDMGLGFEGAKLPELQGQRFIRGNHDKPSLCREHANYAGDFGVDGKLFFLGGAASIDKEWRVHAMKVHPSLELWWPDEELSSEALEMATKLYVEVKPEYVVTHEAPDSVRVELLREIAVGFDPEKDVPSRTSAALQGMLDLHRPKAWVFGHYHVDAEFDLHGTRFLALGELSTVELDVG